MLLVGLLIGVTVSALKPGVRNVVRDGRLETVATRHITATLTHAVRDLVGVKRQTPAIPVVAMGRRRAAQVSNAAVQVAEFVSSGPRLLRESLLALPPPLA